MSILDKKGGGKHITRTPSARETQGQEPKTYSEAELIGILATEGALVIPQPPWNIPTTINYSGLEPENPESSLRLQPLVFKCANACRSYLSGLIIRDSFGNDHTKRRFWRNTMYQKYGDAFSQVYKKNKLRINPITRVLGSLRVIVSASRLLKVHSAKAAAIEELTKQFPDFSLYHEMSDEERLKIVEKVTSLCKSFLEIVAKE
ncbi:hypothetical protein A3C86_03085 [Candidatus Kaiserbacteria bacterium RIFCSPHIGHO2_02_FULL_49_16]|uniref:Uncharacterized protein n=1 Tax=Candidatus Kaiserbacteria bacterium RIFCSPHIGHO2_02_FULL_49_16 TaxID=1798490 RepID=A0A1F6DF27_9BACT|nr:MAG: hypothetical protein A3C86_03085 [Candidatus Kaiserbacteria bacterium RIFCSPHIGHO2_02_FULL_49_16]